MLLKLKPPAYHDCDEILALIRPVPAEEVFSVGIMNIARRERSRWPILRPRERWKLNCRGVPRLSVVSLI